MLLCLIWYDCFVYLSWCLFGVDCGLLLLLAFVGLRLVVAFWCTLLAILAVFWFVRWFVYVAWYLLAWWVLFICLCAMIWSGLCWLMVLLISLFVVLDVICGFDLFYVAA